MGGPWKSQVSGPITSEELKTAPMYWFRALRPTSGVWSTSCPMLVNPQDLGRLPQE